MPKRYILPSCSNKRKKQQKGVISGCSSSDVEKSVFGNFHQGSNIFPEWSRGRQCVSNALLCILYKYLNLREVVDWTSGDIDFILKNEMSCISMFVSMLHMYI